MSAAVELKAVRKQYGVFDVVRAVAPTAAPDYETGKRVRDMISTLAEDGLINDPSYPQDGGCHPHGRLDHL